MTKTPSLIAIGTLSLVLGSGSYLAFAQAPGPQAAPMSFFITSVGMGKGGDLGGLAGADAYCQRLAAAAGGGAKTWHAVLAPPSRMQARGLHREALKVGATATVVGYPNRTEAGEMRAERIIIDGKITELR